MKFIRFISNQVKHIVLSLVLLLLIVYVVTVLFKEHPMLVTVQDDSTVQQYYVDNIAEYLGIRIRTAWDDAVNGGTSLFEEFTQKEQDLKEVGNQKVKEIEEYWDSIKDTVIWEKGVD